MRLRGGGEEVCRIHRFESYGAAGAADARFLINKAPAFQTGNRSGRTKIRRILIVFAASSAAVASIAHAFSFFKLLAKLYELHPVRKVLSSEGMIEIDLHVVISYFRNKRGLLMPIFGVTVKHHIANNQRIALIDH